MGIEFTKYRILAVTSLALVTIILLSQTIQFVWFRHIAGDLVYFYLNASYFVKTLTFSGSEYNAYQPGALLYFFLVGIPLFWQNNFYVYLNAFFLATIALVALLAKLYSSYSDYKSQYIYAILLLSSGPIIFFRFELFVIFLFVLALFLWKKNKRGRGLFVLGIATSVKLYPVITLPYFLLISNSWRERVKLMGVYLLGMVIPVLVLLTFFQTKIYEIVAAYNLHSLKSVHIESLFGVVLTVYTFLTTGHLIGAEGRNGIVGFPIDMIVLPLWFYNYFWLVPVGLVYLGVIRTIKTIKSLRIEVVLLILLVFLTFSKVFSQQYFLWYLYLLPLVGFSNLVCSVWWRCILLVSVLINLSFVYVYPLNYDQFIDFFSTGNYSGLFWIHIARFILLIGMIILFWKKCFVRDVNDKQYTGS